MNQEMFDTLMLLITETVSSQDYLTEDCKIYLKGLKTKSEWERFVRNVQQQDNLTEGIYYRKFSGDSVHYYALKKKDNKLMLGNGYPNAGGVGSTYGKGLDAQKDRSHGLCQTYALMYYYDNELSLIAGNYEENVKIGLRWLENFTTRFNLEFNPNMNINLHGTDTFVKLKNIYPVNTRTKVIYLNELVSFALKDCNEKFLDVWFAG
jgi:hypothetical protein